MNEWTWHRFDAVRSPPHSFWYCFPVWNFILTWIPPWTTFANLGLVSSQKQWNSFSPRFSFFPLPSSFAAANNRLPFYCFLVGWFIMPTASTIFSAFMLVSVSVCENDSWELHIGHIYIYNRTVSVVKPWWSTACRCSFFAPPLFKGELRCVFPLSWIPNHLSYFTFLALTSAEPYAI